jgi:hypothetical protein
MTTLMPEAGADIRRIQQMLGHAQPSTTQIHTRVSIRALQQVHALRRPAEGEAARNAEQRQEVARQILSSLAAEATEELDR